MTRLALTLTAVLTAVLVGLVAWPSAASAHSGKQSYLYVSIFDDGVEGRVEMPITDVNRVLGFDIPLSGNGRVEAITAAEDELLRYVADHTALGDGTASWTLEFGSWDVLDTAAGPYLQFPFDVDVTFTEPVRRFVAEFDVIFEVDPQRDALLLIENDWRTATFDNEGEHLLGFSTGQEVQVVELGEASVSSSLAALRRLGTDAVRTGIDLMVLVAGWTLAVVSAVAMAARGPVPPLAEALQRSRGAAVAFAGSTTVLLWVAGLGLLTPSERLTGIVVAAVILLLASAATVGWFRPASSSAITGLSAAAGAALGLGAGVAFEARGLDRTRPVISLVAYQLGVFVAVLLIAAVIAALVVLLRRTRLAGATVLTLAAAIALYGALWIGERLADADWPIEEIANPLRVWPRNWIFVALALGGAVAIRSIDRRADRLRPVAGPPSRDTPSRIESRVS